MSPFIRVSRLVFGLCLTAFLATEASASVTVQISNSAQRMRVYIDGGLTYAWPVSTARRGYRTPAGSYGVQRMERMWYSRKYHMSPMPHALFFRGGYAIHGTYSIRQLGRPASHGCVRLSPGHASTLFALVRQHGGGRVVVTNGAPAAYAHLRGAHVRSAHVRRAHLRSAHVRSYRAARIHRAVARRPMYPVRTYSADPWMANPYAGQSSGGYAPFGFWY